jgi:Mn-containing catalase
MILRIDRLGVELPPPSTPDPAGAAAVQELMGGKFGEMSTLMNYTFQSMNFRFRQGARPFYDLIANIAAEEYGHVELVGATINTMLTDVDLDDAHDEAYKQHYLFGGKGALPADSHGKPWNGSYVHSSGDLVEDLTHNYFLETGARSGKLRVYEMCDHPAARALTGADMTKLFPSPRIPTAKIPECQPHIEQGLHLKLYRFSPEDYREMVAVFNGPHPETGEDLMVVDEAPEGFPPYDLPPQPDVFAPDYAPEEIQEIAQKLRKAAGLPDHVTGIVANDSDGLVGKVKDKLT